MEICVTFTILMLIVALSIVAVGLALTVYELLRAPLIETKRREYEKHEADISGES